MAGIRVVQSGRDVTAGSPGCANYVTSYNFMGLSWELCDFIGDYRGVKGLYTTFRRVMRLKVTLYDFIGVMRLDATLQELCDFRGVM